MKCYRCGASLASLSLPLSRLDSCPECSVDLHACLMCVHYDPGVPRQCREDDANEVKKEDKARANFCDYFKANADAFDGSYAAGDARARDALSSLFGDDGSGQGTAGDPDADAEDLFK